jgi:signal recognition particle GTPase
MEAKLLAADVSKQTHDSIIAQINSAAKPAQSPDASTIAGLLLGSPEFQRR